MKLKYLLTLTTALMLFGSCNKNNSNDLTSSIVGTYTNAATSTLITVNKIDYNTVSISLKHDPSCEYTVGFTSVKMNTKNSFTLNDVTRPSSGCGNESYTGTGTHSGNNISIFALLIRDQQSNTCCGNKNFSISASK